MLRYLRFIDFAMPMMLRHADAISLLIFSSPCPPCRLDVSFFMLFDAIIATFF